MGPPPCVAVLGGTFDPVHLGHLAILEQVRRSVGAGEAWLLPTNLPGHRDPALASVDDRLAMVRAAAEGHAGVRVVDVEARRQGPSFTVDTLDELERDHPGVQFWLVLGADAARDIARWHRAAEVLARARFVLVNRTGVPPLGDEEAATLGFDPGRTRLIHVDSPPLSATEIRRRVAAGEGVEGMVGPAVARIIAERGLYRSRDQRR
jgi:nicotinate-nucleotide adenylyltransferase